MKMGERKGLLPFLGFFAVYCAATAAQYILEVADRRKLRKPPSCALAKEGFSVDPALIQGKVEVGKLPLCQVLLVDDANFPVWLVLVPRQSGLKEIIDLTPQGQTQLWKEVTAAMRVIKRAFNPDKLNMSAIGNMVSQLHIHCTGRMRGDVAWPNVHLGAKPALVHSSKDLQDKVSKIVGAWQQDDEVELLTESRDNFGMVTGYTDAGET